jgi:hypothetical protein
MSILYEAATNGIFTPDDLKVLIKRSNYFVSSTQYEDNYYEMITRLHKFETCDNVEFDTKFCNNGLWKLNIDNKIPITDFIEMFVKAWGGRNKNFTILINHIKNSDIINKVYDFIDKTPVTLLHSAYMDYMHAFVEYIFPTYPVIPGGNFTSLVYISKFCSTFLPDLCIPVDTASLNTLAGEYKIRLYKQEGNIAIYYKIHEYIRNDLLKLLEYQLSSNVVAFKLIDTFGSMWRDSSVTEVKYFDPCQIPLNRPIDKIYYSV